MATLQDLRGERLRKLDKKTIRQLKLFIQNYFKSQNCLVD